MKCSVLGCSNDTGKYPKKHGITYHPIPKDSDLKAAWLDATGLLDCELKGKTAVCSDHFREEDFYITNNGVKKVKTGAVPVVEMSAEELASPADLKVCRVCLLMDRKMYHLAECKLDTIFEQVIGVRVSTDDGLPRRICWECAQRLRGAARFRGRALRAHARMLESLRTNGYLAVQDIKSIDRAANRLTSPLIVRVFDSDHSDLLVTEDGVKNERLADEWKQGEPDVDLPCDMEVDVEVKNEEEHLDGTEIFCEEFPDHFESDDDKKLSEFSEKTEPDKTERLRSKQKKVKKRKEKEKRVRVKKKEQKIEGNDDPSVIIDKYKISDVKRRKTQEGPNESLFTVSTLTYEEQIAEVERRQESASYRSAPFKCGVCYRGFMVRERYDAHSVRHSEASGAFPCLICKTRLRSARALRKHLTAQHTEQFSCKGCPFVTRNRGVAREHEKWHAGTKYQCPHCASEFDKLTTYMGHIRIKHVSDFVCELCGYTFVSRKGIDVHKKKKHRAHGKHESLEGPYCATCDVRFVSEEAHARHLKLSSRHSSDNDPNRIRNDSQSMGAGAERGGRAPRRVERRAAVHARDGGGAGRGGAAPGPVTCEQCGVQLGDLRLYAQHFRRVHPDKNRTKYPAMKTPAMCEQCGRIFQSMALLKDHMWVHTGEKRFKCDRCDKSFTQKTNLMFHMRVHSNARPSYECPLCGKHFAFLNNRRRHMFIHTGLKPFKCDTCGKCFTTAGEQRAHLDHVHLKKPWPKRARHAPHGPHGHGPGAPPPQHYKGMGPSMED